ncbi:ATPase (plasmid) [Pontibacillus sp. ALD_SL1]|uniref:TrkH family potassium uptake protein n=1 Tax=Pontibacillus sp. ALD_SL1 TaxID=2777185 RepID=UPI001A973C95|nr:potassium transporter TrkG [Pontibacillus sp. ALD_SL1]QST02836.1 ATPase [Pontibacillus sp. ALD_SL1]
MYVLATLLFSGLYMIPAMNGGSLAFEDAVFLSASAISVTGLSPISVAEALTPYGHWILLAQIQIGGMGIMVLLGLMLLMFKDNVSLSSQTLMSFDQNARGFSRTKRLIGFIFGFTLVAEGVGFLMFFLLKGGDEDTLSLLFHATSSFTNAGFDLFGTSLMEFESEPTMLLVTSVLILLGSLGFPVLLELIFNWGKKRSLFFKVTITVHGSLLIASFLFFLLSGASTAFKSLSVTDTFMNAWFLSVTSRSGGLSTFDLSLAPPGMILLLFVLMFIGGSPSSCGGGIRTTTFAVVAAKSISILRGHESPVLFRKSLHDEDVNKSFLVVFVYFGLFFVSSLVLLEVNDLPLVPLLFEVMSAVTTTGLSMGATEHIDTFSKLWISGLMIIGRVGIVALMYSFIKPKKTKTKYVKEYIVVG